MSKACEEKERLSWGQPPSAGRRAASAWPSGGRFPGRFHPGCHTWEDGFLAAPSSPLMPSRRSQCYYSAPHVQNKEVLGLGRHMCSHPPCRPGVRTAVVQVAPLASPTRDATFPFRAEAWQGESEEVIHVEKHQSRSLSRRRSGAKETVTCGFGP